MSLSKLPDGVRAVDTYTNGWPGDTLSMAKDAKGRAG